MFTVYTVNPDNPGKRDSYFPNGQQQVLSWNSPSDLKKMTDPKDPQELVLGLGLNSNFKYI